MSEAAEPGEPIADRPTEPTAGQPEWLLDAPAKPVAAPPEPEPIVYVGGAVESSHTRPSRAVVAALAVAGVLLVAVAGTGLYLLNATKTVSFKPVAGSTAEPAITKAFVDALHRGDPAGMRAVVTKACLADQSSSLCFGPDADGRFQQSMAHRTVDLTFLRRYDGKMGTIVLYDLFVRDTSTGEQVEWVLTLRLAADGKIDRAVTS
jgi:hypothetical protein